MGIVLDAINAFCTTIYRYILFTLLRSISLNYAFAKSKHLDDERVQTFEVFENLEISTRVPQRTRVQKPSL